MYGIDISRHKDGDNAFPHLIEIFAFLACTGDISLCWIDELFIRPIICSNRNRAQRPVILL